MKIKHAVLLGFTVASAPAWAINKCAAPDGKMVFQDAPCAGEGETLDVRLSRGFVVAARTPAPIPVAMAPMATPVPAVAAPTMAMRFAPTRNLMEVQADKCLAWYKPLLRDPASAYYTEPRFEDKRVMRMTLHAKNGYGGVEVLEAVCEFENGKLSESWTKLQAKRVGWEVG